jgi:glycosyltransferase involved in cell wall biosynthesis
VSNGRVSVCIPTFNKACYLKDSIASVLAQRFAHFELVVLDDASTDHTPAVVAAFRDPRLRYIRYPENVGLVANFSRCLEAAYCEYVIIFHDDDVMMPELLGREVALLDSNPGVVLVHCAAQLLDIEGCVFSAPPCPWPPLTQGAAFIRCYWSPQDYGITMSSVMLRRSVARRIGGFNADMQYSLDADLWQRMAFEGKVAFISDRLVSNRVHAGQATSRILVNRLQMLEERLKYAQATRTLLRDHNVNLDSEIAQRLSLKIARDLTELKALNASTHQMLAYARAAVRRFPNVLLGWRFYGYMMLAFLPSSLVRRLKTLHGQWFLWKQASRTGGKDPINRYAL